MKKPNIKKYNEWKRIKRADEFLKENQEPETFLDIIFVNLDLSDKNFEEFPIELFFTKEKNKINYLDLSNNKIKKIPKEIKYLKNIRKINLKNNQIDHIPEEIKYLKKIKELDLSFNNIKNVSDKIINYLYELDIKCLQKINLAGNNNLPFEQAKKIPKIELRETFDR